MGLMKNIDLIIFKVINLCPYIKTFYNNVKWEGEYIYIYIHIPNNRMYPKSQFTTFSIIDLFLEIQKWLYVPHTSQNFKSKTLRTF